MPQVTVRQIDPIIRHGLQELQSGAPVPHVLREVALMGAMLGAGLSSVEAINVVERLEQALIGLVPGEERYHRRPRPPIPGVGAPYGWESSPTVPTGMPSGAYESMPPSGYRVTDSGTWGTPSGGSWGMPAGSFGQ